MIGRIGAQTAKQVIIQKIREAERDSLIEEFRDQIDHMVSGQVQRNEGSATTVSLGNVEALLPRSEQIPGESHHANERVRALGLRSPTARQSRQSDSESDASQIRSAFVRAGDPPRSRDGVISVNAMAREPGYRSKVAVSSTDQRVTVWELVWEFVATVLRILSTSWLASALISFVGTMIPKC